MELISRRARWEDLTAPDGSDGGAILRYALGSDVAQIARVTVPPLHFAGWQVHGERDEWHIALKGRLLICQSSKGGLPTSEGDPRAIFVPALVPHGILNPDEEPAELLIAASVPAAPGEDDWLLAVAPGEIEHLLAVWEDHFA